MRTLNILAIFLLIIISCQSVQADTLTVGTGADYSKIQDAINAAKDGDAIAVAEGEYDEDLVVSGKKELVITSSVASTEDVVLKGNIEIKLDAHDIELQDFSIDATGKSYGVKIIGKTEMNGMIITGGIIGVDVGDLTKRDKTSKIQTSTIQGAKEAAIDCKKDCWIEISGSTIQNVILGAGIRAKNGNGRVRVTDSTIKNNKNGVAFTNQISKNNQVWRNTFEGNVTGILLVRSNASLKNLTFTSNKKDVIKVR